MNAVAGRVSKQLLGLNIITKPVSKEFGEKTTRRRKMKSTTKAVITISAVFAVLFVPPLFFDTSYVESFGETGMRSFCAIFVSIVVWALFHRVNESRQERRKNNRAEIARDRMKGCVLFLMFIGFGVALAFTLNFILCMEGY